MMWCELRYCGNVHDPRFPNHESHIPQSIYEDPLVTIAHYNESLRQKYIGRPQASLSMSVTEMINEGLVGTYVTELDDYAEKNPELIVDYGDWIAGWCDKEEDWIVL